MNWTPVYSTYLIPVWIRSIVTKMLIDNSMDEIFPVWSKAIILHESDLSKPAQQLYNRFIAFDFLHLRFNFVG